jgi:GNAT superfamily N-acetyltransferase
VIRAFDSSLADAKGLLAVERATFSESPYCVEELQAMLTDGSQRAWLAVADDTIIGFVAAFPVHSLQGVRWEIDLLAVHPDWRGRGIATDLVRAAAVGGLEVAERARAVVATDNIASARAFGHAGFEPVQETCELLIFRIEGLPAQQDCLHGVAIWEVRDVFEAADWLPNDAFPTGQRFPQQPDEPPGLTLLLAEQDGQPAGYLELIEVHTILYSGVWIESLVASTHAVREALIFKVVNWARAANLDEMGAMVPHSNKIWQRALVAQGFRSLGSFDWLEASLPLPNLGPLGRQGRRKGTRRV